VKKTLDPREKKWMIAHMARPPDEKSDVRWSPQTATTIPDGSGAPRTLAMWWDAPRNTPRSQPRPDFSKTAPYLEPAPRTDNGRSTPVAPNHWVAQSPQPAAGRAPLAPVSVLPPYGGSVAQALSRRPRWGLWTLLGAMGLALAMAVALPFLPRVPPALRPVRDAIAGLTGFGNASAEVAAEADAGRAARGPRIVPLPAPSPVMAAPPADPRLRRAAGLTAARTPAAPRVRTPIAHGRPELALAAPAPARAAPAAGLAAPAPGLAAPAPARAAPAPARAAPASGLAAPALAVAGSPSRLPAAADPFEDAPGPVSPRATSEARYERPARPVPAPAAAPPVREVPAPAAAVAPVHEASPPPPHAAPAAPKPVPGSLDDLMATAVMKAPAPAAKSELDKELAGIDETREQPRPKPQETPAAHTLTRFEIQSAMKAVQPKVSDCGRQFQASGAAELKVTVADDGAVKAVNVMGVFAGTPTAECLARAVKTAVFPASAGLRFTYPLSLH
jgi:hypothetical protein